jgi:hypothetical protein
MKYFAYTFLIAFVFSFFSSAGLFAQQDSTAVIENISKYVFSEDGQWLINTSQDYSYNSNNLKSESVVSYYNSYSEIEIQDKKQYFYDNALNLSSVILQKRKPDSDWKNYSIYLYAYDNNHNCTRYDYQVWSDSLNDWDTTFFGRVLYTYNQENLVTNILNLHQHTFPNNYADSIQKANFNYDALKRQTREVMYTYSPSGAWALFDSKDTKYNDSAKSYSEVYYTYNNDTIVIAEKTDYLLNERGDILSSIVQASIDQGKTWTYSYKTLYDYDSNASLVSVSTLIYYDNEWQNSAKTINTYINSLQTESLSMNWSDGQWVNNSKTTWRYKKVPASAENEGNAIDLFSIKTFPNPASSFLNIIYELPSISSFSLKIYDSNGKTCISARESIEQEGSHSLSLSFENLPSGVYFCEFKINGSQTTRQFIICK